MNFLNINLRRIAMIGIVVLLPLVSINMQQSNFSSGWYDRPFFFLASLAQNLFYNFSTGVRDTTSIYLNLIDLKKNSLKVKSENQELLARLQAMKELEAENMRMKELLGFKQATKMDLVAAKIMGKDLVSDHNTIQINKGTSDGLHHGQAVITTNGVVGYVFKPELHSSLVLLITDRYAVVDGIVSRSRARGIVVGNGGGGSSLRYVEKSEDVKDGDLIVTGGLDNVFPKGFPIATVEKVENKSFSVSLKIELKPFVDPDKIEEVFVILNAANEQFEKKVSAE